MTTTGPAMASPGDEDRRHVSRLGQALRRDQPAAADRVASTRNEIDPRTEP